MILLFGFAFSAVPLAVMRLAVRHGFRGDWGDLSPQRGCVVLAQCVPRYGMPTAYAYRIGGGCGAMCKVPAKDGTFAHR